MFYSPGLLSRKGPLGVIWIAAHCYRKLRKVQVVETDISSSVGTTTNTSLFSFTFLLEVYLFIVFCSSILIRLLWSLGFGFGGNGCCFFMIS